MMHDAGYMIQGAGFRIKDSGYGMQDARFFVWLNGETRTREEMLEELDKIGASYKRVVVVLQPHVRKSRLEQVREAIRKKESHQDKGRLRQLDTLLLGAQASCRAVGAELWVVADQI